MSEINSIANGTYMIGETTQTEFQAGNGISITQPSEGTVRIANDETVLWEGFKTDVPDNGSSTYTLSELATNFETVRIEYVYQENEIPTKDSTYKGNCGCGTLFYEMNSTGTKFNTYIYGAMNGNASSTSFTTYSIHTNIWNMNKITWNVYSQLSGQSNNAKWFHITKIVGINRISGGNI